MRLSKDQIAVIVPIYNSSRYLKELFERISQQIPQENIIAVNDASQDNSAEICQNLGIKLINIADNKGKGAALRAGFIAAAEAGYLYAFTIDSDLQHLPEDFSKFIDKLQESDYGVVIGNRDFSLSSMPWARIISNSTTSKLISLVAKQKILDSQSGFRLYKLAPITKMKFISERYQFETEVILKLAKQNEKIAFVPIDTIYNDEVSYISHFRDIGNFIKIFWHEIITK